MAILQEVVRAAIGLVTLAILFGVLEWLWPENRQQPKRRPGILADVLWWFAGNGTRFLGTVGAVVLAVVVMRLVPLTHPWVPQISQQPGWLQAFEVVFIGDFLGYWIHRLFHGNAWLWPFHAIHHSSEQLDWLSATRVHPVDSIAHRLVPVALFYLLGFSGTVLGPFLLFLALYPIALHANLALRFGPLSRIFVSPAFHRWHHTAEEMGLDKNFAGLFAMFDYIFGTAYLPRWQPSTFGLYQEQVPRGFFGQLLYPFRRKRPTPVDAEAAYGR